MTARPHAVDALAELQQQFLSQVRGAGADVGTLLAAGQMPASLGLGIYGNAYGARLREALGNDHPVLGSYLGDDLWERMCEGFIATHPSRVRSLRDFGAGLPGFLASTPPFAGHPQLAELARFERCLLDGFDAADDTRLPWDELATLPPASWPTLQLEFHPSFRVFDTGSNCVEAWQAIKAGMAPPEPVAAAACWALWRDEDRVCRFRSLDPLERMAIRHVLHGGSFAGLCEALATELGTSDVPVVAIGHLQSWCADGWLSRLY